MTIFDSHCHPQFPQYDADREEMIKRNLDKGIFMIAVGADIETSKKAIELADQYDGIWATVGLHPDSVSDLEFRISDFKQLLDNPKVVGVGEVGLDYYRKEKDQSFDQLRIKQKEVFSQFINLSLEINKPLVLHCRSEKNGRSAHADAIEILKTVNSKLETGNLPLRGVAHSFTGSIEEAQKYLDLGFYLGLNGIVTFTHEYDEMIKNIPLDRILVETDAPWLTPEPYRGQRNEPSFVTYVVDKLREIKQVSRDEIISQTNKNCTQLFKII